MSCHLSFETLKIFLLTTVSHRNNVDDINTYIHYTNTAWPYYVNTLNMANTLVLVNKQWFIWSMDN